MLTATSAPQELHDVELSVTDGVARVTVGRPPVNAVSSRTYLELIEVFEHLSGRVDVHAIVLGSAVAGCFSAGADIREQVEPPSTGESVAEYRARLARTCYSTILDVAQPTVAAVDGYALGAGAVLAACCDIRVVGASSRIGLPEINAGRCGGARHLMRLIPQGTVRLMYFTGEPLSAADAERAGLVQVLTADGEAMATALELAGRIARKSPQGLRLAKRALNESESMEVAAGYRHEQLYTLRLSDTEDAAEAVAATLEKRAPVWSWGRDRVAP